MRPARMESGGGSSVASCFSTPDLTSIETSRWNGVLRRRIPVKIERNERQRCLIKNAGSWGLWSRAEPEKRRNHSGATRAILSDY